MAVFHRRGERSPGLQGHTLIELLVSLGIFILLGSALIALLNQGVSIWHLAEARGRIYERGRALLDTVAEDLRHAATNVQAEGAGFWIRFLCDEDASGRQRLRFVRALAGESSDPIARRGGEYLARSNSATYDHHQDFADIQAGLLLAPGGYQEVIYAMGPDPKAREVLRGVRSPIGEAGSIFIDGNIEVDPKDEAAKGKAGTEAAEGAAREEKGAPHPLLQAAQPLAGEILYLGFRFWTPATNTWDPAYPPLAAPKEGQRSGATEIWDSTRAILEEDKPAAGHFAWKRLEGSLADPYDDLFPEKVEVVVVIQGNPEIPPINLTRDLGPREETIWISSTIGLPEAGSACFIKIDEEWIRYEKIGGSSLTVPKEGRGARGTAAAKHPAGAKVEVGTAFRRVVEIPGCREPAAEAGKQRGGRGGKFR
ncbi:MAG: hypothetical protein HY717_14575 [Planctomycetes bacterium]|nr:hypothetical protein [Planctomycetota bacterium]